MNKSNTIKELASALQKAQAEMPVVQFDATNPFLKKKFASLGAVIETSRPILAKHGLSVSQFPTSNDGAVGVTTILAHSSGEWMEDTVTLPLDEEKGKSAAQVAGSVITYLRRYSWAAVLGLYADEDTDGTQPERKAQAKPAKVTAPPVPEDESKLPIDARPWSIAQKNALIDAKLAKNEFAAKGMLGLSALPVEATPAEIVDWGKVYRKYRNVEKMAADIAAANANAEVLGIGV